jgi:hypothetical protein
MTSQPTHRPGDHIDLYDPPEHCGEPMTVWNSRDTTSAHDVVCGYDLDHVLHTDYDGVILCTSQ